MNRKLLMLAVVLAVAVTALPVGVASGATDEGSSNYFVEGYVVKGDFSGNIPMPNVNVTIIENGTIRNSTVTNEDGYFLIGIMSNTKLQISFTAPEFTVRSCPATERVPGSDILNLDLSKVSYDSATKTYSITSDGSGMQCAVMVNSTGNVRGTVSYSEGGASGLKPIANARITLISVNDEDLQYSTTSDSNGQFSITCPVGTYYRTVTCNGFIGSGTEVTTVTTSSLSIPITLVKDDVNKYAGLDTAHVLMVVAVLIGILLVTTAWLLSRKMRNKSAGTDIVDDDPEDDIRYP